MIYRVYPLLLFILCFLALIGGFAASKAVSGNELVLFLIPVPAVMIGYALTSAVAIRFPRIRYVNNSETDGLGYTHQPLGPMLLVSVIGFAVAIANILK